MGPHWQPHTNNPCRGFIVLEILTLTHHSYLLMTETFQFIVSTFSKSTQYMNICILTVRLLINVIKTIWILLVSLIEAIHFVLCQKKCSSSGISTGSGVIAVLSNY